MKNEKNVNNVIVNIDNVFNKIQNINKSNVSFDKQNLLNYKLTINFENDIVDNYILTDDILIKLQTIYETKYNVMSQFDENVTNVSDAIDKVFIKRIQMSKYYNKILQNVDELNNICYEINNDFDYDYFGDYDEIDIKKLIIKYIINK